jgi:hypothetical protein
MEWEKRFVNHATDRGLILRLYKDVYNSITIKKYPVFKNGGRI